MRNMFRLISKGLSAGENLVLVTLIASSGATPRGAGGDRDFHCRSDDRVQGEKK